MYAWAEKVAEGKFHGTIEEQGGKLVFKGTVATEAEKNEIWNAIKTIPTWQQDINADIRVTGGPSAAGQRASARGTAGRHSAGRRHQPAKTYTVKSGDTLSQIAKEHLGNAGRLHEDL
jgi:LysM repeat protein